MHLAVAVSSHGYGHGAQTAAVLTALRARCPQLRLTLLTGLPSNFLHDRIPGEFELIDWRGDFGMRMHSALEVDLARSAADYSAFHATWDRRVGDAAALLEKIAPDLLLVNVPYLALAAAARVGLPSVALCSLNWSLIYEHYFGERPEARGILRQMQAAHESAEIFLCPEPSMAMPELSNVQSIGPLARLGRNRRALLHDRLGIDGDRPVVVIAPGGIPFRLSSQEWPRDVTWVVPDDWDVGDAHMQRVGTLGLQFTDLLTSADAVFGKLGYGTVAECACNGTPLLYLPRADWPEESVLADWLSVHGRCAGLDLHRLSTATVGAALNALWAESEPSRPVPTGAQQAAHLLALRLETSGASSWAQ